jgi:hypothetical protein
MATAFETPDPFTGPFAALPAQLLEASTRAINASAELYTEVLTTQAEATRAVLEAYAGLGAQAVQASAETSERAEQVATTAARRTGTAAKRATRRTSGAGRRAATKAKPAAKAARPAAKATRPAAPAAAKPPIAGYDGLTADEVLAKLPEQPQTALAQIAAYEQAHENRATVLQRVAALTGPEPAPGYDAMSADEAQKLVAGGSAALAAAVRDYERRHKDRAGVVEAATRNTDADAS